MPDPHTSLIDQPALEENEGQLFIFLTENISVISFWQGALLVRDARASLKALFARIPFVPGSQLNCNVRTGTVHVLVHK